MLIAFNLGDLVEWESSYIRKEGYILHVVAAGRLPSDFGNFPSIESATPRKHESYIVAGKKETEGGKRKPTIYWPRTSLLKPLEKLSRDLWGFTRPNLDNDLTHATLSFAVGYVVKWTSSYVAKSGKIVSAIPAGSLPSEINPEYVCVQCALDKPLPRDHVSYIVLGSRLDGLGKAKLYWPRTALLRSVDESHLTIED